MAQYSEILRQRGGLMIAAAGNHHSVALMGSPACISSVVSVGAVDADDQVMAYSDATTSLDLLAPGDQIMTTGSFGGVVTLSGTSAAAPHVTGAAALVLSASPDLSSQELEERLKGKGVPVLDGRNGAIYPRVDAYRALVLPVEAAALPPVISRGVGGRNLTVRVEPAPPFQAADMDPDSFTLMAPGGQRVPADGRGAVVRDGDRDGIPDLILHFPRREVLSGIHVSGSVVLTLEGSFFSGPGCRGKVSLRIAGGGRSEGGPGARP
jgi:subtilisin family serine protease